jgi:hypothetical protein
MQTTLNFNRDLIIYGHLQAEIRLKDEKIKKQALSIRSYKGHKTKRKNKQL